MEFLWEGFLEAIRLMASGDRETFHAVYVSLLCTVTAVTLAAVVAIPYGAWLGLFKPRAHRLQLFCLRLGMSVPTVVIGLVVFGVLSRHGPLGALDALYTKSAIVAGELLLALPLLGTFAQAATSNLDVNALETAMTLGATRGQALRTILGEVRTNLVSAYLAAFGRCITELGIAITVGGNLYMRTRTLPSKIQLELSRGDFGPALAPGIVLLLLASGAVLTAHRISQEDKR